MSTPTRLKTDFEEEREKRMETDSPDLPFAKHHLPTRDWGMLLALLVLGLSLPLFYIGLSLLGAISSTGTGFAIMVTLLLVTSLGSIAGLYAFTRSRRRQWLRDQELRDEPWNKPSEPVDQSDSHTKRSA